MLEHRKRERRKIWLTQRERKRCEGALKRVIPPWGEHGAASQQPCRVPAASTAHWQSDRSIAPPSARSPDQTTNCQPIKYRAISYQPPTTNHQLWPTKLWTTKLQTTNYKLQPTKLRTTKIPTTTNELLATIFQLPNTKLQTTDYQLWNYQTPTTNCQTTQWPMFAWSLGTSQHWSNSQLIGTSIWTLCCHLFLLSQSPGPTN